MPQPLKTVSTQEEVRLLETGVRAAAAAARESLQRLITSESPLDLFHALKFDRVGFEPLEPAEPLNLLEQVHKTFAYLVTILGAEYLLRHHPEHAPYTLSFGSATEPDILSHDGKVAAESCALISPRNNNKLNFDIGRMRASPAVHRYVFYHSREEAGTVSDEIVRVMAMDVR